MKVGSRVGRRRCTIRRMRLSGVIHRFLETTCVYFGLAWKLLGMSQMRPLVQIPGPFRYTRRWEALPQRVSYASKWSSP